MEAIVMAMALQTADLATDLGHRRGAGLVRQRVVQKTEVKQQVISPVLARAQLNVQVQRQVFQPGYVNSVYAQRAFASHNVYAQRSFATYAAPAFSYGATQIVQAAAPVYQQQVLAAPVIQQQVYAAPIVQQVVTQQYLALPVQAVVPVYQSYQSYSVPYMRGTCY